MEVCICEFDEDFDEQPCLGLWLVHIQPERLGSASSGLLRHWETKNSDRIRKGHEEMLRRQLLQEAARERRRQIELRLTMAWREEREERAWRSERLALGDLLWVAGAPVPAPNEVQDPGLWYEHRLALWDHDWVDHWRIRDHWHFAPWGAELNDDWADWDEDRDVSAPTDFDSYFDLDDYADSGGPTHRSRRRDRHGAPQRRQIVKAWVPQQHSDGVPRMESNGASEQRATSQRQKASAVSHPRRQRSTALANTVAQQRQETALARRLREMQRSRHRQSVSIRRACEVLS